MPELDDATAAYILETGKAFEDLRQVAAQLAGLLVLEAAGARSELPQHPMLPAAEELFQAAAETVRSARATARARRHHDHLMQAAADIHCALRAARRSQAVDPILTPLRSAYAQLEGASRELPGFEMVAFGHGCCAAGGRSR
jgi:hypothetical protein